MAASNMPSRKGVSRASATATSAPVLRAMAVSSGQMSVAMGNGGLGREVAI